MLKVPKLELRTNFAYKVLKFGIHLHHGTGVIWAATSQTSSSGRSRIKMPKRVLGQTLGYMLGLA